MQTIGVEKGAISLDQRELVSSFGPYVRDELEVGRFAAPPACAPIRCGSSCATTISPTIATTPASDDERREPHGRRGGAVSPLHSIYANVGTAFETPTTTELGNQSDGTAGLNRDLKPQFSTTYEVGAKGLAVARVQYDVALFDSEIRDELIPFATPDVERAACSIATPAAPAGRAPSCRSRTTRVR